MRSRIGRRLLAWCAGTALAVALLQAAVALVLDRQAGRGEMHKELARIERIYATPLADSVWNLERRQIQLQMRGIADVPGVTYVAVLDTAGAGPARTLLEEGHRSGDEAEMNEIALICPCDGALRRVGTLRVQMSLDPHLESAHQRLAALIGVGMLSTLLVAGTLLLVVHRVAASRLLVLNAALRAPPAAMPHQRARPDLPRRPTDELDEALEACEARAGEVAALQASLLAAEEASKRQGDDLEARVVQRTTELHRQTGHLRTLIDALPGWIWLKDPRGRYLVVNRRFADERGLRAEALVGRTEAELPPGPLPPALEEGERTLRITRQPAIENVEVWGASGLRVLRIYRAALLADDGALLGTLGVARDADAPAREPVGDEASG